MEEELACSLHPLKSLASPDPGPDQRGRREKAIKRRRRYREKQEMEKRMKKKLSVKRKEAHR